MEVALALAGFHTGARTLASNWLIPAAGVAASKVSSRQMVANGILLCARLQLERLCRLAASSIPESRCAQ